MMAGTCVCVSLAMEIGTWAIELIKDLLDDSYHSQEINIALPHTAGAPFGKSIGCIRPNLLKSCDNCLLYASYGTACALQISITRVDCCLQRYHGTSVFQLI